MTKPQIQILSYNALRAAASAWLHTQGMMLSGIILDSEDHIPYLEVEVEDKPARGFISGVSTPEPDQNEPGTVGLLIKIDIHLRNEADGEPLEHTAWLPTCRFEDKPA